MINTLENLNINSTLTINQNNQYLYEVLSVYGDVSISGQLTVNDLKINNFSIIDKIYELESKLIELSNHVEKLQNRLDTLNVPNLDEYPQNPLDHLMKNFNTLKAHIERIEITDLACYTDNDEKQIINSINDEINEIINKENKDDNDFLKSLDNI